MTNEDPQNSQHIPSIYIPRLLEHRIEHDLATHPTVMLIGPAGAGKATTARTLAASTDYLDPERVDSQDFNFEQLVSHTHRPAHPDSYETVRVGSAFTKRVSLDPSMVIHGAEPHLVTDIASLPATTGVISSYSRALAEVASYGALITTSDHDLAGSLIKQDGLPSTQKKLSTRSQRQEHALKQDAYRHVRSSKGSSAVPISHLRMLTLSLQESGLSTGEVSLAGLFEGRLARSPFEGLAQRQGLRAAPIATTADIARVICRGGWPQTQGLSDEAAIEVARHIAKAHVKAVATFANLTPDGAAGCAWALARCVGEVPTYAKIASGMEASNAAKPARDTVRRYLHDFERSQLTLPVYGWNPPDRIRTRVRTKPKHYFVDPSIPAGLLALAPTALAEQPELLTRLLHNMVARDLHIYVEALGGGRVCHYLDDAHTAASFVVEMDKATIEEWRAYTAETGEAEQGGPRASKRKAKGTLWGGIQVVLSDADIEKPVHDLLLMAKKNPQVAPAFLMVLTGHGDMAYRRDDDVFVVPLSCLGA